MKKNIQKIAFFAISFIILTSIGIIGCKKKDTINYSQQKENNIFIKKAMFSEYEDLVWSDYFETDELIMVIEHPNLPEYLSNIDNLFIMFPNFISFDFCQEYNHYFYSFFESLTISNPMFLEKEDFMYLLLDQAIEEIELYGINPTTGYYKGVNAFARRCDRADRQLERGSISEYQHCCKINEAIVIFNNKNQRDIYPEYPCDELFPN